MNDDIILLRTEVKEVWAEEVWFKNGIRVDLPTERTCKWNGHVFENKHSKKYVHLAKCARANWKELL